MWVGDCRVRLGELGDGSVDSVVCDPPYELGFMGKAWDASGVAYDVGLWVEVLRVLKPGGHLLAFGGSRTYHRLACAVEDAGFEIRDQIMWVYGSGFPKSLDVSKAIDKAAGAEREVVGLKDVGPDMRGGNLMSSDGRMVAEITAPATDDAQRWQGWGTALKPAHEPIVVARKPLAGTVAANVLTYGTGALNIDGCRVGRDEADASRAGHRTATFGTQHTVSGGDGSGGWEQNAAGRWPANLIHDGSDEVVTLFPDSSGGAFPKKANVPTGRHYDGGWGAVDNGVRTEMGDGSAARFFYCAKTSKKDRNEGLDDGNTHPTVKPTELMRYLVRLVTPPNGLVLDPFCGSGSTGKAAVLEGFQFLGIEQDAEYAAIAEARIRHANDGR